MSWQSCYSAVADDDVINDQQDKECMMEDGYLWIVDAMLMIKSIRNTREGLCPFVLFNCSQRNTYLLFLTVGGK